MGIEDIATVNPISASDANRQGGIGTDDLTLEHHQELCRGVHPSRRILWATVVHIDADVSVKDTTFVVLDRFSGAGLGPQSTTWRHARLDASEKA